MKYTLNKTQGEIVPAHCRRCGQRTRHKVNVSYDGEDRIEGDSDDDYPPARQEHFEHFQIIECQGCENVALRHRYYIEEGGEYPSYDKETLQPAVRNNISGPKNILHVPRKIYDIYSQTVHAYCHRLDILCAGGVRATLEAICVDRGITQGTVATGDGRTRVSTGLDGKIAGLAEGHVISNELAEQLHAHRFLGNDAMHALAAPDESVLEAAIGIIELVIRYLYEGPVQARNIRNRVRPTSAG